MRDGSTRAGRAWIYHGVPWCNRYTGTIDSKFVSFEPNQVQSLATSGRLSFQPAGPGARPPHTGNGLLAPLTEASGSCPGTSVAAFEITTTSPSASC
jgi:hypothetical protein